MTVPPLTQQITELSTPHASDKHLLAQDRQFVENKIHHFVMQQYLSFTPADLPALQQLRDRAVLLGNEKSSTVQKIDTLIALHGKAVEDLRTEMIKKYTHIVNNLDYYDPSQLSYEAEALWNLRDKGAYAVLLHDQTLPALVYGLFQAADCLASKQLDTQNSLSAATFLGNFDPSAFAHFSHKSYITFLKQFVKEQHAIENGSLPKPKDHALHIAQSALLIEMVTPTLNFSHADGKLLRVAGRILEKTGIPHALNTQLQHLERQRKTFLALLPDEILEKVTENFDIVRLLDFAQHDPHMQHVSAKQATALLNEMMLTQEEIGLQTTRQLAKLAGTRATSLNLADYRDLTDAQLIQLMQICPNLEQLDLSGCTHLTAKSLLRLGELLPNLKSLNLTGCVIVDDLILISLRPLQKLETIQLNGCDQISNWGLFALRELTSLKSLSLAGNSKLTDSGLKHLLIHNLEQLNIASCAGFTDEGLKTLAELTSLGVLSLRNLRNITSDGFNALKKLPHLKYLSVAQCGDNDFLTECMRHIDPNQAHAFAALEVLDVSFNSITQGTELEPLYKLPKLQHIFAYGLTPELSREHVFKAALLPFPALLAATMSNYGPYIASALMGLVMVDLLNDAQWFHSPPLTPSPRPDLVLHK